MSIVKGGGFMSYVWECIVVIAAALAVITNVLVIGTVQRTQRDLVELTAELYGYELATDAFENRVQLYEERLAELEAQVRYGLADRYNIGDR